MSDHRDELPFLPFAKPTIGEEEIQEVVATLRGGWVSMGPRTIAFEKAFAEYAGARQALAVSSCTAALHLALAAHRVGEGDEVITSSLTFAATGNVVEHAGARPVFAEIDPATMNITAETIEARVTAKTRAVILVHYAGLPCDIDAVRALCARRDLVLIEDAAHAVGTRYRGRPIGAGEGTVCFSFYANKNMTTGEGGMFVASDPAVFERAQTLRLHGMSRDAWRRYSAEGNWRYDILDAGFKYNMNDIAAALGLVQLRKLDGFLDRRAAIAAAYRARLGDLPGVSFQATGEPGDRHAYHIFVARFDPAAGAPDRDAVIAELVRRRIGFSVHFLPLHLMTHYRERWGHRDGDLPVTERVASQLVSLPLFPEMTDAEVERVCAGVRAAFAR